MKKINLKSTFLFLSALSVVMLSLNSFAPTEKDFAPVFMAKIPLLLGEQLSAGGGIAGQFNKEVGQVYVPEYLQGACTYEEHWYVGKDYKYPGSQNPVKTTITPKPGLNYSNVAAFKADMKKKFPGGHYIKVVAHEEIPGCPNL